MNQISFPSLDETSDDQETAKTTMNYDDNRPIAPKRKVSKQPVPSKMPNNPLDEFEYEEVTPGTNKYGYEEAAPTTHEGAAPAAKYCYGCYGEAEPTTSQQKSNVSRRSSFKSTKSMPVQRRRASMECTRATMVEVRVRSERFPVQRRRSIEFDKTIQIREVKPVLELAKHDELWLQQEDFVKMKSDRRSVVKKHRLGTAVNDEEPIRGLEKYLDKNIRMQKNRAWDTVLLEQDEQELAGHFNEQRIADLYRHTTDSSPQKAAAMAKQDQEDVREYLLSPRTTKLMMRRLSC
jgi:hypothetical protein